MRTKSLIREQHGMELPRQIRQAEQILIRTGEESYSVSRRGIRRER